MRDGQPLGKPQFMDSQAALEGDGRTFAEVAASRAVLEAAE
jgi:hypothetical protein